MEEEAPLMQVSPFSLTNVLPRKTITVTNTKFVLNALSIHLEYRLTVHNLGQHILDCILGSRNFVRHGIKSDLNYLYQVTLVLLYDLRHMGLDLDLSSIWRNAEIESYLPTEDMP
ncbi:hypothetical protein K7432_010599 [Basidiobolus ranarum]|uniref:Uncharacterized protein n=1 Tax=Basidiobolus ranarum TaxID=34480 RepID=A0ABR2VV71_9FUNG